MNKLCVLIHKEWRDQRLLMTGAFVVCVAAIAVAKLLHGARFESLARTSFVLPGCLALFTLVIATETITRDVQNGVESTLVRLPVPRSMAWLAKLSFVALSMVGFWVLLVLVELTLRILEHGSVVDGLFSMIQPTLWLQFAALGAACMASACVLKRSLPAAFLGVLLIWGVPLIGFALPVGYARERMDLLLNSWTPGELWAIGCAAFLFGSFIAFLERRLDPGCWRRAGAALLGVVLVVGPVFANSVRLGRWAFDIVPFSSSVELDFASPSPDGKYIALQVRQIWTPQRDWLPLTGSRTGVNCRVRSEIWILDPRTGEVREIDERFRRVPCNRPWDVDGRLATVSTPGAFGDGEYTAERIDPATAKVVASHPESESDSQDYRYGFDRWLERKFDGNQGVYSWRGTKFEQWFPRDIRPIASPEPGVLFYEKGNALLRYEFEGNVTRTLVDRLEGKERSFKVSPDGRFLNEHTGRSTRVIDAHDGHVILEWSSHAMLLDWSRVPGRIGYVYSSRAGAYSLQALLEDGSLQLLPGVGSGRMCEFGPDRVIEVHQSSVECVKLDGTERRELYPAREQ